MHLRNRIFPDANFASILKAGILKAVTPHTLRHSYATGLLEAGGGAALYELPLETTVASGSSNKPTDVGLGHKSFSTTMIYLHVRRPHLGSTPSPIDWLPVRQLPGWAVPDNNHPDSNNNRESPTS